MIIKLHGLLAVGLLSAPLYANDVLLDFESQAWTGGCGVKVIQNPYVDEGFRLSVVHNGSLVGNWWARASDCPAFYTGSTALSPGFSNVTAVLSAENGAAFDLVSLDLGITEYESRSLGSQITFTGQLAAGGTVTKTVTFNSVRGVQTADFPDTFQGVTSVSWPVSLFVLFQLDNVVLHASPSAGEQLQQLAIDAANAGPGKSLTDKVALAVAYYEADDLQSTCNVLQDFTNQVRALSGKKLAVAAAVALTADAQAIMTAIGCD